MDEYESKALLFVAWKFPDRDTITLDEAASLILNFLRKNTPLAPALEGEPVFVLRARDRLAPFTVSKWAGEAEAHGCPKEKVDGARRIAAEMIAWQQANGVKAPD